MKKSKAKKNNFLLLNGKKLSLILVIWIVSVILHNFLSNLLKFEEPVFFMVAVILIPIYIIISIVYTIIKIKNEKRK